MSNYHTSVLLNEAVDALNIDINGRYIDATLGGGGHTKEILRRGGEVLGIDTDTNALEFVKKEQTPNDKLKLALGNFKDIDKIAHLNSFDSVNGIILDLGVSSFQIDTPERGFSYQNDGPLDMRMNKDMSVKAADLVNILTKGELNELFSKLGEEHNSRAIADRISQSRRVKRIETADDLARAIVGVRYQPSAFERARVLKRVFQALRIAVNDELNNLREVLPKAIKLLKQDGRLVVISFHSLEDRIVKNTFLEFEQNNLGRIITKKPVIPGEEEVTHNRRSKSAKMRVFQKI